MTEAACPFGEAADAMTAEPGGGAQAPDVLDTSFRSALRRLDRAGLLARVSRTVDADLEVAGLMKRHDAGAALLFESVKDHDVPVVGNVFATPESSETAMALDRAQLRPRWPGASTPTSSPSRPPRPRPRSGSGARGPSTWASSSRCSSTPPATAGASSPRAS